MHLFKNPCCNIVDPDKGRPEETGEDSSEIAVWIQQVNKKNASENQEYNRYGKKCIPYQGIRFFKPVLFSDFKFPGEKGEEILQDTKGTYG